jgi:transposase
VSSTTVRDLFGVKGRKRVRGWRCAREDETVQACLRHIEFLDSGIEHVERTIATGVLDCPRVGRLLAVAGVGVICAAVFLAAVGDIRRFKGSRQVVADPGRDPRVY